MEEEQEIIEVEAIEKPVDGKEKKEKKPQKAKYQYGGRIALFSKIDFFCLRFFFPSFTLGAIGSLMFGILYSENPGNVLALVWLIVLASLAGLGLLAFLFHFLLRALIRHWMKLDPNYQ